MTFDAAQLVIDDEIVAMTRFFKRGVPVNDGTTSVEEIMTVGPAGDFLELDSTLKGFRALTAPRLIDRKVREAWEADGRPDFYEKGRARARQILAEHEVEPLDADVQAELRAIVARADARYAR